MWNGVIVRPLVCEGTETHPGGCEKVKINHLKPRLVLISRTKGSLAVHISRAQFMRKNWLPQFFPWGYWPGRRSPLSLRPLKGDTP